MIIRVHQADKIERILLTSKAGGCPGQAVMHAVSCDLLRRENVPEDTFYAPADKYEPDDWRDPFVFWNEDAGQYRMLLAARTKEGPAMRKGCTALCVKVVRRYA